MSPIEPREFRSVEEIDAGIARLERPIRTLDALDIPAAVMNKDLSKFTSATMDVTEAICDVFGANSPEFYDHHGLALWVGREPRLMGADETIRARERGRTQAIGTLCGLIGRLREKRSNFFDRTNQSRSTSLDRLNLHPALKHAATRVSYETAVASAVKQIC